MLGLRGAKTILTIRVIIFEENPITDMIMVPQKRLNPWIALHGKPTSELRGVTCHVGSRSVTCRPTQVNAPRLNPSHTGRYLIYLTRKDERLSWPWWLVACRDGLPARKQSPMIHPSIIPCSHSYCLSLPLCLEWYNGSIAPRAWPNEYSVGYTTDRPQPLNKCVKPPSGVG